MYHVRDFIVNLNSSANLLFSSLVFSKSDTSVSINVNVPKEHDTLSQCNDVFSYTVEPLCWIRTPLHKGHSSAPIILAPNKGHLNNRLLSYSI